MAKSPAKPSPGRPTDGEVEMKIEEKYPEVFKSILAGEQTAEPSGERVEPPTATDDHPVAIQIRAMAGQHDAQDREFHDLHDAADTIDHLDRVVQDERARRKEVEAKLYSSETDVQYLRGELALDTEVSNLRARCEGLERKCARLREALTEIACNAQQKSGWYSYDKAFKALAGEAD
jgi:hypothetical protein